jgi:hypothetical protein
VCTHFLVNASVRTQSAADPSHAGAHAYTPRGSRPICHEVCTLSGPFLARTGPASGPCAANQWSDRRAVRCCDPRRAKVASVTRNPDTASCGVSSRGTGGLKALPRCIRGSC